ncbi:unnamed protein product [Nyctereutes procyonoides]|uniref:(raccoon dog) hypothetical protein n=1 Tax=Nyctereutes procyonoides TaxID=34880 RepID=A0A811YJT1_NYCPR|nr:unnamed protein product [Nyctereutes procyonoides]
MKKKSKKRTLKPCTQSVYTSKIISSNQDLLAVVFHGTEKDRNSNEFQKYLLKCCVCANLFSDVQVKMSHKRIMMFTNEDDPHGNDSAKASRARIKAGDLHDTGIFLDLMHLKKCGGFDISLFYRDIISIAEDEDLGVHFDELSKLEDLLRKVHAKETQKHVLSRLKLKLSKDTALTVGIYNMVQKAVRPPPVRLYQETNEPVKSKTRTFNVNTGSLLLPSDTKRSQNYGNHQIVLEKEETEELKRFDEPGLILNSFKPLIILKKHHYLRPSLFVYPEESLVNGSSTLFIAPLTKCLEKVMAVCRYIPPTPRRNIPPYFKIHMTPPGFQLVFLPYADDKRKVPFTEKVMANPEQIDKMKAINPVLQQHFRNLEVLALDLTDPEQVEDLTLPKIEAIDKRLGSLVNEFKELVYPPDYSPEGKAPKQKQDDEGLGSKRPKMELSEEELRAHVNKDTLACRVYGQKGGLKKQELLDILTKHFQKN